MVCLVVALLAACTGLSGPRTLHIPQAQMQAVLDEHFPLRRRVLEIFELRLDTPQLRMLPQRERLAATLAMRASNLLNERGFDGRMTIDFGLRYDAADASVRLLQPHVASMETPSGLRFDARLQRLAAQAVEAALDGLAVYRLKPTQIEALRAAGYRPGALTVTAEGLTITFEPLP